MGENELGAFLRSRRDALTPAQAGLPEGPRRRAPGLRRSEVATLAGVSVEYLTRLEQGRDRNPSAEVLTALAGALQLTPDAYVHLHRLAKTDGGRECHSAEPPRRTVRPTVRALVERLEPSPAAVFNRLDDVLAHTNGFARLVEASGLLDGPEPNLTRFVFADPRARSALPDWERVADAQTARLRSQAAWGDGHMLPLVEELSELPEFASRWRDAATLPPRRGVHRWVHPGAGELRLAFECLDLPDYDGQYLLAYIPDDAATAAALDRLTGLRPGALRAVGN
ncbi:helix-turn-helix domain-containing protein [Nocardiopsis sp. RSe5-2]|uniref:Helix-turn-helix domain-containing protein n=1 Tax=Nocardiopsis endophytica TaxID=3018445 RepID=A0ABT4U331_9ACTN|nr:helix-turn-helix domain-containing protein [Nocardiopsis endophytica]MDA2811358.1 helix-turn-helix domain-containing protein [Nocardiopsis endophytica]